MAAIGRHRYRTVRDYLFQQYGDFDVFQLMRLLLSDTDPALPIGQRLRFRADLSAAFPAREFTRISLLPGEPDDAELDAELDAAAPAGRRARRIRGVDIRTANFCIASVTGPLPESFTEWVRELASERATAMADFLDMFNQRANVLRYQVKQALTPGLNDRPPGETEIAGCLAALSGLADPRLAARVPLPQRAWLGIAGLLANRRRPASTLVDVLGAALDAQVSVTENVGAWHELDVRDRCVLGVRNHQLGRTLVVGRRVWDQQARLRIEIGVVDYDALQRLLPPPDGSDPTEPADPPDSLGRWAASAATARPAGASSNYAMLCGLVKLLVDRLADCEIVLHVREASVPGVPLPQPARGTDTTSMRLGQSAWLAGKPAHPHASRPVRFLIRTNHAVEAA
ncbi:type VI secretion system baseplate subunit TssG [Burkholderia sp. 3C]